MKEQIHIKQFMLLVGILLLSGMGVWAQENCETGYCPPSISVHHYGGSVAPFDAAITYEVVESNLSGTTKCWIARNLGATAQASSATDASVAARGWFWQFNRKQGYAHDGTTRTPSVLNWIDAIDENSDWLAANDPCTILLGSNWHIPTATEWTNVNTNGAWATETDAYNSVLKMHSAGRLDDADGALTLEGNRGFYWSSIQGASTTDGTLLRFDGSKSSMLDLVKARPMSLRCIRTY